MGGRLQERRHEGERPRQHERAAAGCRTRRCRPRRSPRRQIWTKAISADQHRQAGAGGADEEEIDGHGRREGGRAGAAPPRRQQARREQGDPARPARQRRHLLVDRSIMVPISKRCSYQCSPTPASGPALEPLLLARATGSAMVASLAQGIAALAPFITWEPKAAVVLLRKIASLPAACASLERIDDDRRPWGPPKGCGGSRRAPICSR